MKPSIKFMSVLAIALIASVAASSARAESSTDYPRQFSIQAREIKATHRLNTKCMVSTIDLVVNFATGSDKLTAKGAATVKKVAAIINDPSFRGTHVRIEGYTDSVGKPTKNLDLSQRRALRVMHALVDKYGVPAGMLSAEGMGDANPIATNSTGPGRAMNRRVSFTVVK